MNNHDYPIYQLGKGQSVGKTVDGGVSRIMKSKSFLRPVKTSFIFWELRSSTGLGGMGPEGIIKSPGTSVPLITLFSSAFPVSRLVSPGEMGGRKYFMNPGSPEVCVYYQHPFSSLSNHSTHIDRHHALPLTFFAGCRQDCFWRGAGR